MAKPEDDAALQAIHERVRASPGPVFPKPGRHFARVPRCSLSKIRERVEGAHERRIFLALITMPEGSHPSGLWAPDIAELAEHFEIAERTVRAALASLDRQGVVVWDPIRVLIFVPDVTHLQMQNPNIAKAAQGRFNDFTRGAPVDALRAYIESGTVPRNGTRTTKNLSPSTSHRAPQEVEGPPEADTSVIAYRKSMFDLEGWKVPVPEAWPDERIEQALDGEHREEAIVFLTQLLHLAQQRQQRARCTEWKIRELLEERIDDGRSAEHLMRCLLVRWMEAQRTNDAKWLTAPACFGEAKGRNPAATTQVMVAKSFDDDEADRLALTEYQ